MVRLKNRLKYSAKIIFTAAFAGLSLSTMLFSVVFYAVQFSTTKSLIKPIIANSVSSLLNATFTFDDFDTDLIENLTLHGGRVVLKEDTLLTFSSLSFDLSELSFFELLHKGGWDTLTIPSITLRNPTFMINYSNTRGYNFSHFQKLFSQTTKPIIFVNRFISNSINLENGKVLYYDADNDNNNIHISKLSLTSNIDFNTNQKIDVTFSDLRGFFSSKKFNHYLIASLNFHKKSTLATLSGSIDMDNNLSESAFCITVPNDTNLTTQKSIFTTPFTSTFHIRNAVPLLFNPTDLTTDLTTNLGSNKSELNITCSMSGILDSIMIDNFTVMRGENIVQANLELRNALTSPKVHFLSIRNTSILLPEIKDVLKFAKLHTILNSIEKYPFLSHALSISGFYNLHRIQNSNENFRFSVVSTVGESTLAGNMNLKQKSFDGKFSFKQLNFHHLLNKPLLRSNINFEGILKADITDLSNPQFTCHGILTNSMIRDLSFSAPFINIEFKNKLLLLDTRLTSGNQDFSLHGSLNLTTDIPKYSFEGYYVGSIETEKNVIRSFFKPSIRFFYDLKGTLVSSERDGTFQLSIFQDSLKLNSELFIYYKQRALNTSGSQVEIFSPYLDFKMNGDFNLSSISTISQDVYSSLINEYFKISNTSPLDLRFSNVALFIPNSYQFSLIINNQFSKSVIFNPKTTLQLSLDGDIKSTPNLFTASINGKSNYFKFDTITFSKTTFSLFYQDSLIAETRESQKILSAQFQSRNIKKNMIDFSFIKWLINYKNDQLTSNVRSIYTPLKSLIDLDFSVLPKKEGFEFSLNDLTISFPSFLWSLSSPTHFLINNESITIPYFAIENENQKLEIEGKLSNLFSETNLNVKLSNFSFTDAKDVFQMTNQNLEGTLNFNAHIFHNNKDFLGQAEAKIKNFKYSSLKLTDIHLNAKLINRQTEFVINGFFSDPKQINLTAKQDSVVAIGTIPTSISFSNSIISQTLPITIKFEAKKVPLSFLSGFFPMEQCEGHISFSGNIFGTFPNISYLTKVTTKNSKFSISNTGVSYNVAADLSIDPSKLEINSFTIQDDQKGKAKIFGKVNLSFFKILNFNLRSQIDKLSLLNIQNINMSYPISGKLVCSSNNVLLKGTNDKPNLSGSLTIDDFDLSSQNTYSSTLAYNSFDFIKFTPRENLIASNKINLSDSIKTYFSIYPENKLSEQSNTFLNKLTYNLDLTSDRLLKYTHILDQKFGAELSINVNKLSLNLQKSDDLFLNGYANINSGNFKYYATNFKLEDGGSVVWVNNKISDGKLSNVLAKKSVSLYNLSNAQTENIDIFLKLSDNISNPKLEMGYSISYPNTNETHYFKSVGSSLSGIEDANAESTIFGILITGQRANTNNASTDNNSNIKASSIGLNIVSNFIAQQVSRILGNISWIQSFNIGLDNSLTALDFSITGSIPGLDNKWFFTVENRGMPMTGNQKYTYGGKEKIGYAITPNISIDAFHSNQRSTFNLSNLNTDFFGAGVTYKNSYRSFSELLQKIGNDISNLFNPSQKDDMKKNSLVPNISTPNSYKSDPQNLP